MLFRNFRKSYQALKCILEGSKHSLCKDTSAVSEETVLAPFAGSKQRLCHYTFDFSRKISLKAADITGRFPDPFIRSLQIFL
jgi:hypothetical protein